MNKLSYEYDLTSKTDFIWWSDLSFCCLDVSVDVPDELDISHLRAAGKQPTEEELPEGDDARGRPPVPVAPGRQSDISLPVIIWIIHSSVITFRHLMKCASPPHIRWRIRGRKVIRLFWLRRDSDDDDALVWSNQGLLRLSVAWSQCYKSINLFLFNVFLHPKILRRINLAQMRVLPK